MIYRVQNSSIYYEFHQVNSEPPIIFLHAALGSMEDMRPLHDLFPDRSALLLDFPGHGKSNTKLEELSTASLAKCVKDLLDHLGISSTDIIGYSLGGYVALELAMIAPERIRSIVSHAMKFYWTQKEIDAAIATFAKSPVSTQTLRLNECMIRNFLQAQLQPSEITSLELPLLLSTGENDTFVTPSEVAGLAGEIHNSDVHYMIFPQTGHSLRKLPLELFEKTVRVFWKRSIEAPRSS